MSKKPAQIKKASSPLFLFGLGLVLVLLTIFELSLFYSSQKKQVLGVKRQIENEKEYWYALVKTYPDYLPAWLEIMNIEESLENETLYLEAKNQVVRINPNYSFSN